MHYLHGVFVVIRGYSESTSVEEGDRVLVHKVNLLFAIVIRNECCVGAVKLQEELVIWSVRIPGRT